MRSGWLTSLIFALLTGLQTVAISAQEAPADDRFLIVVKKKFGYIDRNGKVVIRPSYEIADDFHEDRAVVESIIFEEKYGYVDKSGRYYDLSQYDMLTPYSEGLAAVGMGSFFLHGTGDHRWGFIDKSGRLVIDISFREYRKFTEGLAAVMNDDGKWGYIDRTGKLVIPFQFDAAFEFSEGMASVLQDGLFGFIDKSGKMVIAPRFTTPSRFQEGVATVEIAKPGFKAWQSYGNYVGSGFASTFIDKSGNEAFALPEKTVRVYGFSEGLAAIEVNPRENVFYTAFIDLAGKQIIKLRASFGSRRFSQGLASVEKNGRFGFIDRKGRVVIPIRYRWAEDFRNGLALISTGEQIGDPMPKPNVGFQPRIGYVNLKGKVIWKPIN